MHIDVDFKLEKQKMKVCFLWQAFDVLGRVEAYLKLLKSEGLSLPVLAARHEELHREIKDCTADALQKGQALISQVDSCRWVSLFLPQCNKLFTVSRTVKKNKLHDFFFPASDVLLHYDMA